MATMHEVDYEILGDDLQFVKIELDPGEAVVGEAGAMMYIEDGIQMQTIFGDGSAQSQGGGLMGALLGAGKRLLVGESLFMTVFQNQGQGKKKAAFAAPYPGKIIAIHLAEIGGELIAQKDSFLVAAKGVSLGIAFTRRFGAGLFGGEGFILERLQGDGWAFVHAGGTLEEKTLAPGELLRVDTGCIVAMQPSVAYDIQMVGGLKSMLFGGEGLFFATLRGPGKVWLQSLPFSRLASRIYAAAPQTGGRRREEGSLLGGLGNLLDGDGR
ncbi:MAG: TIGR00266 family protein [Candidatus Eisenbacteria bacterium]|nr:TIGR00266 family protein [Candidatus Eisenbacteria bacterium]